MNGTKPIWLFAGIQAGVTAMLLTFSYLVRNESPGTSDIVVGAAVYHWFRESTHIGRQINDQMTPPRQDHPA